VRLALVVFFVFGAAGTAAASDLYHPDTFVPLTSDWRSFKVGDALTVKIVESSSAESDATSNMNRSMQTTAGLQGTTTQHTGGVSLDRQTSNTGSTSRNGTLQAEITTRVTAVSPNGDMTIHGIQAITVNGEMQRIEVSGVVRPIDVAASNVVLSTRLYDARIEYNGKGFVDRSQHEDLISRILDFLGL
jgi:flagellar L-ring protein precursor FlgH